MADLPLTSREKTHYTNMWCRSIGIKSRDLDNHPCIDDAIILIKVRDFGWTYMNAHEKGVWAADWNRVYHKQFPLKASHIKKIEDIMAQVTVRIEKAQQARLKIKQQRKQIENGVVHIAANPTPATGFVIQS